MNKAFESSVDDVLSAIAVLEAELNRTAAGTEDYKLILSAIGELSDVVGLLASASRPF